MNENKATVQHNHTTDDVIRMVQEAVRPTRKEMAELIAAALAEMKLQDTPRPLLTVDDVAQRLGVSLRTVETLIAEGSLTPIRIRTARRFTEDQIDAFLRHQEKRSSR